MAAIFRSPVVTLLDASGAIIPGGKVYFYDATTTSPRTVYSDAGLTTPRTQPVVADSAGRLPVIYMTTGPYKIVVTDADDVLIAGLSSDNLDSGLPAGSTGILALASGGTGASTAAGARTNLAAVSQADFDALSASLVDLATLDTIDRTKLASGFGTVILQGPTVVASTTSLVTCTTAVPADDTIPQVGEGDQVLSGNFTPKSASSTLHIAVRLRGGASTTAYAASALFTGASSSAIASAAAYVNSANYIAILDLLHTMASPGTNQITFSVRAGPASGSLYINGIGTGTRLHGGVQKASLIVTEYLAV
jgi:hypothetical protein